MNPKFWPLVIASCSWLPPRKTRGTNGSTLNHRPLGQVLGAPLFETVLTAALICRWSRSAQRLPQTCLSAVHMGSVESSTVSARGSLMNRERWWMGSESQSTELSLDRWSGPGLTGGPGQAADVLLRKHESLFIHHARHSPARCLPSCKQQLRYPTPE